MARRRSVRRKKLSLPPELRALRIAIREDGRIDLGIRYEDLMEYLLRTRKSDEEDRDSPSE